MIRRPPRSPLFPSTPLSRSFEGGDPPDGPPSRLCDEVLRCGVPEEGVLPGREQRAHVHPQLRHPLRVAAVMVVGKGNETFETAPVRDGRDPHSAQTTPNSFPSLPKVSSA